MLGLERKPKWSGRELRRSSRILGAGRWQGFFFSLSIALLWLVRDLPKLYGLRPEFFYCTVLYSTFLISKAPSTPKTNVRRPRPFLADHATWVTKPGGSQPVEEDSRAAKPWRMGRCLFAATWRSARTPKKNLGRWSKVE